MIGYVTMGSNNMAKALEFYDSLLATIGIKRLWGDASGAAWGTSRETIALCLTTPYDGNKATVGNGSMIALRLDSKEQVDSFHAKALALGGSDEGAPGPRGDSGFYGGYFRDLDGNKLNAYLPGA